RAARVPGEVVPGDRRADRHAPGHRRHPTSSRPPQAARPAGPAQARTFEMTRPCDQLGPFLDQELSAAEAAAFRMHLAGCPDCPARLDAALQLAGLASEAAGGSPTAASAKAAEAANPPARF